MGDGFGRISKGINKIENDSKQKYPGIWIKK